MDGRKGLSFTDGGHGLRFNRKLVLVFAACLLGLGQATSVSVARELDFVEAGFDFGHIGIDYKVFHNFLLFNNGEKPYKVDSFKVSCDCTNIKLSDSTVNPGDTVQFSLSFETKNYYGPTNKTFTIYTDYQPLAQYKFYYQSIIGQWVGGLKPSPESVMLLPGHKPKTVSIPNRLFDEISIISSIQHDSSFTLELVAPTASKGGELLITIAPGSHLKAGTHMSSLTIKIATGGDRKPVVLTIPTRIVKY